MELTIEQALQRGVTAHKEGKLQEAEKLYRAILQSQPQHPDANHNLGLLAINANRPDVALPLFRNALQLNPKMEQFWISYIDALIKSIKGKLYEINLKFSIRIKSINIYTGFPIIYNFSYNFSSTGTHTPPHHCMACSYNYII